MGVLSPPILVVIAVFATALAQVLLKKASYYEIQTTQWLMYMGISAFTYALSFVLYSRILKYYALNKIYPAMTVGHVKIVAVVCSSTREAVSRRSARNSIRARRR